MSKTLAWDLGAGSEHHDAGVVRHPTKRKIFRTWPLMATGAVSFRLPSLPMAPAEMREKLARSCTRTPSGGIATSPTEQPKTRGRQGPVQTHVGMHAQTGGISEGTVGLEAQFRCRTKESEFRLGLHARVGLCGCLSGSPAGVLSLRCASRPCRLGITRSNSGPCFLIQRPRAGLIL